MSKMKVMPIQYSVYPEKDNPIFGDGATHISIDDEAAGPFIVLKQYTDDATREIRLDLDEIDIVFETIKKLVKECNYEDSVSS